MWEYGCTGQSVWMSGVWCPCVNGRQRGGCKVSYSLDYPMSEHRAIKVWPVCHLQPIILSYRFMFIAIIFLLTPPFSLTQKSICPTLPSSVFFPLSSSIHLFSQFPFLPSLNSCGSETCYHSTNKRKSSINTVILMTKYRQASQPQTYVS